MNKGVCTGYMYVSTRARSYTICRHPIGMQEWKTIDFILKFLDGGLIAVDYLYEYKI
jgi:hypothetical protein